jgi:DNA-directed RNA polymerase specialized sigma24 family protein
MVKLSPEAVKRFGQLFRDFKAAPTQQLKEEMISIFAPQIERKAAKIAAESGGKISAVDYAQDLYLEFLEKLETFGQEEKRVFKKFSTMVSTNKPSKNARTTLEFNYIEELSPMEELNKLSCRVDEQTTLQKAKEIVERYKNTPNINDKRKDILSMIIEGKSFNEIGEKLDISEERVRQIYTNYILPDLKQPNRKEVIKSIVFDDVCEYKGLIPADKPLFTHKEIENLHHKILTPNAVREIVQKDIQKMTAGDILETLATEQLGKVRGHDIFHNETRIANLAKNKKLFLIKLPEKYNCPEFFEEAERFSIEKYGRNIFMFM